MSLRGICNCSGHCGNPIMKFSLMFYNAILDRVLDFNIFNKHVTLKHQAQFWDQLLNEFIFNNDENIDVNKMYGKNINKEELFKDVICLIYQMVESTHHNSKFSLIDFDTWDENKNRNNWQGKLKQIFQDSITDNKRIKQVRKTVEIMFHSLREIYCPQKAQESESDFLVNRLFKAILTHNNHNEDKIKPILITMKLPLYAKQNMNASNQTKDVVDDYDIGAPTRPIFKHEIWQPLNRKLLSKMFNNNGDDVEDLTLMRMLILTVNFMVESEATLKTNIKCINFDEKENEDQRLENEIKTNGIYNSMDCNARKKVNMLSRIVESIYNDDRLSHDLWTKKIER